MSNLICQQMSKVPQILAHRLRIELKQKASFNTCPKRYSVDIYHIVSKIMSIWAKFIYRIVKPSSKIKNMIRKLKGSPIPMNSFSNCQTTLLKIRKQNQSYLLMLSAKFLPLYIIITMIKET